MRRFAIVVCGVAALLVSACSERPQTATARKVDDKPWEAASTVYAASGYKASDRAAWEQQMKSRAQGQDEYGRTAK